MVNRRYTALRSRISTPTHARRGPAASPPAARAEDHEPIDDPLLAARGILRLRLEQAANVVMCSNDLMFVSQTHRSYGWVWKTPA
jgi:hypothetical protein